MVSVSEGLIAQGIPGTGRRTTGGEVPSDDDDDDGGCPSWFTVASTAALSEAASVVFGASSIVGRESSADCFVSAWSEVDFSIFVGGVAPSLPPLLDDFARFRFFDDDDLGVPVDVATA